MEIKESKQLSETNNYNTWSFGEIYRMDALNFLRSIPSNYADLIFLDPPFNLGKKYGSKSSSKDLLEEDNYEKYIIDVIEESIRVLNNGAALYFYHIPKWASRFSFVLNEKLNFRHWISISMKNGFVRGDYLYPAHYALLYYTKGEPKHFVRPKIMPDKCRHCNKYIKDYGGYKKFVEDGINISDIWTDFSPVRHKNKKNRPANELPIDLLDRVLNISGFENGILIDPFVGAGTSALSAYKKNMYFIGNDREISCCEVSKKRIETYIDETLV